jgi:hypothetical protein
MVARNAQHRLFQAAENAAKAQIAGGVVLHQIAGDEHCGEVGHLGERRIEHRTQARIGLHPAQSAVGVAVQMRIRDMQNLHPQMVTNPGAVDGELDHGEAASVRRDCAIAGTRRTSRRIRDPGRAFRCCRVAEVPAAGGRCWRGTHQGQ